MNDQSHYFQTIARRFFELRGAPLFLSSQELALIAKWENAGIPLRVVLEGIQRAFGSRGKHRLKKRKGSSLAFCEPQVKDAFAMYKERTVGRKPSGGKKNDKKKAIQESVTVFLKRIPAEARWLEAPYRLVLNNLSGMSESDLEKAEEDVEALLFLNASSGDKETTRKAVQVEFPEARDEERQRILKIKLIKHMRDKYKIPHVAPFYY